MTTDKISMTVAASIYSVDLIPIIEKLQEARKREHEHYNFAKAAAYSDALDIVTSNIRIWEGNNDTGGADPEMDTGRGESVSDIEDNSECRIGDV